MTPHASKSGLMRATLRRSPVPFNLIAVKQVRNRTIATFRFVVLDYAEEGHQGLLENWVIIDRHDEPNVAPDSYRIQGWAEPALKVNSKWALRSSEKAARVISQQLVAATERLLNARSVIRAQSIQVTAKVDRGLLGYFRSLLR